MNVNKITVCYNFVFIVENSCIGDGAILLLRLEKRNDYESDAYHLDSGARGGIG